MRLVLFLAVTSCLVPSLAIAQEKKLDPRAVEFFESKIRPVFAQQCYQCHSHEAEKNKKLRGGLYLDSRMGVLKGGASGPSIVPGKSTESLLLKALRHVSDELKMPPKGKLAPDIVADFAKWVDMGAPDPRDGGLAIAAKQIDVAAGKNYWAFKPLSVPALPQVKNAAWGRTPIDRFILARLEEKKLTPNGPIAKEKVVRRAYFDLTGLPPTPAEIDEFVRDAAPDAYDRLIDRLLASEHYGERWARHWLDLARFAESSGYEFDGDRPAAFHYRDFVIKALNQDMPYDQFVRLQVAGDHLMPGDVMATSATGFLVSGPYPGQTTSKTLALIRYNHLDDMVSTVGSAMLGISVGCARCHAHKYDPIPQEDYYRLIACLSRTDSATVQVDPNPDGYKKAKAAFDAIHAPLLAARNQFEKDELPGRVQKLAEPAKGKTGFWITLPESAEALKPGAPGKDGMRTMTLTVRTYLKDITGIRVDGLAEKSLPLDLAVTVVPLDGKAKEAPVKLKPGKASPLPNPPPQGGREQLLLETEGAVGSDGGALLKFTWKQAEKSPSPKFGITVAPRPAKLDGAALPQQDGEILVLVDRDKGALTPKNRSGVVHWLRAVDPAMEKIYQAEEEVARKTPQPKTFPVFAASSNKGGDVNFLIRGEVEKKGPISQPGFVQVLMTAAEADAHWTGKPEPKKPATTPPRVALANWLTDAKDGAGNLLARVIVNRLWQHHMGRGIVATPNDFGVQGEQPTHPELLEFLAGELIKNGWKLKPIHKLIMQSAVYMQDGTVNPANMQAEGDPQNRLWWRLPARRLEAEAIRDNVLAVGGSLDKTMYGVSTLDVSSPRRSIYLKVKRSQMVPFLQMFDAPEAQQSIGERTVTTVATQSLAFMNSPLVRTNAAKFAQRVRPKSAEDLPQAITEAYVTALGRTPSETERARMATFVRNQTASYGAMPQALMQAWTDGCQVILCLNEFIYVD